MRKLSVLFAAAVLSLLFISSVIPAFADDEIVIEEETIDEGILVNDIEEEPEYVVPDEDVYIDESENAEEVVSADEYDSILVDETSPTDTAADKADVILVRKRNRRAGPVRSPGNKALSSARSRTGMLCQAVQ